MKKNNHEDKTVASLHARARRRLDSLPKDLEDNGLDEAQKLIEKLQIHHVELELQNEELRRVQSELQQTRDKYYQLFDLAPVGYFSIDRKGLITEVNLSGADLLGHTRRSLLRNGFSRLVMPEDQDAFFYHCKRAYQTGNPQICELQLKRKDGAVLYAQLSTSVVPGQEEGDDPILLVAAADITRHKRAEDVLQDSHSMLETMDRERTAEFEDIKSKLELEIKAHRQAVAQIRSLNQRLLESQEKERSMIARELHDSLAQELSAASMQCEHLMRLPVEDSSAQKNTIRTVSDILLKAIASVRNLAYELRPAGLHRFGLVETLENYCRDYAELNLIPVDFQAAGFETIALDEFTEINLYRLVQEGLLNIKKHAAASRIMIRLVVSGKNIVLRIHDNGKGFDVQQRLATLTTEKKLGLRSMQERTDLLHGLMEIDSKPGSGTKVSLKIPIGE